MKKQLIAVAVCGAFCGIAQADGNVTISGILDASVMTASKAYTGVGTNTGSVVGFQDGAIAPSIYALSGKEDLGGAWKAGFNLEGGFSTGNGGFANSNGGIFGRAANVTVGADWGTFAFGLQYDPTLLAAIATDPRGLTDSFSVLEHFLVATGVGGYTNLGGPTILSGGVFDADSISYTYSGNGLTLGLLYGFGGVAGSTEAHSQESIGGTYTNSGFTVSAGWAEGHDAITTTPQYTGKADEIWFVGAGYAWGAFAVRAQYDEFKSGYDLTGTAHNDVKNWGIGADWKVGANTLNLAFYDAKDDGAGFVTSGTVAVPTATAPDGGKTIEWALLDTYALTKRTSVYGQIAGVKVDAQTASSGPGVSGALGGIYTPVGVLAVSGATTTYVNIGIQHTF